MIAAELRSTLPQGLTLLQVSLDQREVETNRHLSTYKTREEASRVLAQ